MHYDQELPMVSSGNGSQADMRKKNCIRQDAVRGQKQISTMLNE